MHVMKAIAIIALLLLVVVNAVELLPAASAFQMYLSGGAVALSLVALLAILVGRGPSRDNRSAGAEAARPMPVTTRANQADAEIVSFLAMLQARGRLVDFLMDDINAHDDAQVGAAARVVHAGCKTALLEHFRNLPRARRERGIGGAGRGWLFAGRVPTAGQDQRPGAVLGSACPPWLENGCGKSTARFAEFDQSTSSNRSGGGGTEISWLASAGCRMPESDHVQPVLSNTRGYCAN